MAGTKKPFISQEYSTETKGKGLDEGTRGTRALTVFAASFFSVASVLGVCLIAFTFMFFFAEVTGTSMMMTINASGADTDSVLVNRTANPKVGDIIVVEHFNAKNQFAGLHIKRLIAKGGDAVHFRAVDVNGVDVLGTTQSALNSIDRFIIEVNGVSHDNVKWTIYKNNVAQNTNYPYYKNFFVYQQTGNLASSMLAQSRGGDAGFRTQYFDKENKPVDFRQQVARTRKGVTTNRFEIVLPKDYIFYMGDHRGGSGTADEFPMSADCAYYGPQLASRVIGVETEIIRGKTAPQWFFDKALYFITFGIINR